MPRSPKSRRWVFTLNNYVPEDLSQISSWEATYLVYGKEVGDSGTPHLQGFVIFGKPRTLFSLKNLHGRCHWEVARGTSEQAAKYCKKDGDFIELGVFPSSQGRRNDIHTAIETLKKHGLKRVAEDHPEVYLKYHRGLRSYLHDTAEPYTHSGTRGYWIYGDPGIGKTHSVYSTFSNIYVKSQNKWWDGYDGQDVVLLDDLDTPVLGHYLKIWSDKWPCIGETKGGTVNLSHKLFIVTSNYLPEKFWSDDSPLLEAINRRFLLIEKLEINQIINFN